MKIANISGWRAVLAAVLCVIAVGAQAQQAAARPSADSKPAFDAGETLYYEFGWNGIAAATAKVWVEKGREENREVYTFNATARTTSFVDRLYALRADGESVASVDTMLPLHNCLSQTENGRKTVESVVFDPVRKTAQYTRQRDRDGGKPPSERSVAIQCDQPGDPVALAYALRCQTFTVGETKQTQIVAGRHLYDVAVKVVGQERIKVEAGTFDALKLVPTFHEVGKPPDTSKVREVALWISSDNRHLLLKVTSEAFVGHVYGELTKVEAGSNAVAAK